MVEGGNGRGDEGGGRGREQGRRAKRGRAEEMRDGEGKIMRLRQEGEGKAKRRGHGGRGERRRLEESGETRRRGEAKVNIAGEMKADLLIWRRGKTRKREQKGIY